MAASQRRAVWVLGLCQCLLWGALYYSVPVLLAPMQAAFGLSQPMVAGAVSGGLLVMALAAPAVGRRIDGGQVARLFQLGTLLALAGLALVAFAPHVLLFVAGWLLVGAAMAMLLYEPAFGLVLRALADDALRLRSLAAVSVAGALASSVALPLLALVETRAGWQAVLLACALTVLLSFALLWWLVLPGLPAVRTLPPAGTMRGQPWPAHLRTLVLVFSLGTLASMALLTLLIPLLVGRGMTPVLAATLLGLFGLAQLPGRLWLLRQQASASVRTLQVAPLLLQAAGLLVLVVAAAPWLAALGVALFGLGAGLQTIVRPWLVQRLYGEAMAGRWNGEVARYQGFARALGPVAAATIAAAGGTTALLAVLGVALLAAAAGMRRLSLHARAPAPAAA